MEVIGLDLSLTSTGVAVADEVFTIKPRSPHGKVTYDYEMERLAYIRDEIEATVIRYGVTHAVMEGPAYGRPQGMHKLGMLAGVVREMLHQNNVHVMLVAPTALKKFATGSGTASKDDMVRAAFLAQTGPAPRLFGDDEADAWFLRHMGLP